MFDLELLVDLHIDGERQGPGGDRETRLAITLARLDTRSPLAIADIGCGTGASARVLASELDAHITAVDLFPQFLARLDESAAREGLRDKVTTLAASMDALDFDDSSLDVIWSEGAIYNIGFENGARLWRRFLKPGGVLAVSDLTWLTDDRPTEIDDYWNREYPEIGTASAKLTVLEETGYAPIGYFALAEHCWMNNYYGPEQDRFADFLARHDNCEAAQELVAAVQAEIEMYRRFSAYVSYGFYIVERTSE